MAATKLSILQRSKRVETEVARYFWPQHDEDETGSVRDWKELWDCSGLGFNGQLIVCEVKSWKWKAGPKGVWSLLENAWDQLFCACMKVWPRALPDKSGLDESQLEPWEVVVYKPTGSQVENALCYFDFHGQMVTMPASQFRMVFIEGLIDGADYKDNSQYERLEGEADDAE